MSEPMERASIAQSRRYHLVSATVGESFQIDVALPAVAPPNGQPLPVVYVMDANSVFGIAAQTIRFLQQGDQVPSALLVGVGYRLGGVQRSRASYGALRTRDFTPSVDLSWSALIAEAQQGQPDNHGIRRGGGAADFLTFLVEELRPFIAEHYDIDTRDQTLVGSSLGGAFCLYAMLARPGAFQRYVANSPALWWGDHELFQLEERLANTASDLSAALFLSVGGQETDPRWSMVDDMKHMAARLAARGYPSLSLTSHIFEGESHTSVIPAALSRGLRAVLSVAKHGDQD
jgi:predicted alpha/beta superfamily hydrolase